MRIILTENDIKKALIAYTSTLGLDLSNHHVEIELTAGRGANGHSATVIIDEAETVLESNSKPVPAQSATKTAEPVTAGTLAPKTVFEKQSSVEDEEVDLPSPTPETPVGKSLFDQE